MPLPASWTEVPITGTYTYRNGDPLAGKSLSFTSAQVVVIGGETIVPKVIKVRFGDDGSIPTGFTLPSTNDPDLNVTGWAYTVTENWPGGREFDIFVEHDAGTIDIASVSPAVTPADLVSIEEAAVVQAAQASATAAASSAASASTSAASAATSAAALVAEYGVVLAADAGVVDGGYPAARSVPRAQIMTRFYAEVIEGTSAIVEARVNGVAVYGPVTVTTTHAAVVNVPLAIGDDVSFECVFDAVTRFWAQLDGVPA